MNDQPVYVTREEFERRMRVLESEIHGEKAVTRYVLEQGRLNGGDLQRFPVILNHLPSLAGRGRACPGHLDSACSVL